VVALLEGRLRADEQREVESDRAWGISAMVTWELTKLWQLQRARIAPADPRLRELLDVLTVWPLSIEVAHATLRLDFSSDPADEIIAATSLVHGAPLLTRDHRILRSNITPLAIR
jgi:PIN domain nuclease of toxin-antitoxin system